MSNEKYNKNIFSVLRNASCSKGWVRSIVQAFFGIIIVSSFTLILIMSLKARPKANSARCRVNDCRIICLEAPYFHEFEEEIIDLAWQAGVNCPRVILTLNRPYFTNNTLPDNWLFKIRTKISELAILGGNLMHVTPNAFKSHFSNNLQTLILEQIEISNWTPETFAGLSSLRQLYIKDCTLRNITSNALQAVDDTLEFLDIKTSFEWNPACITGSGDFVKLSVVDFSFNPFYSILDRTSFSHLRMCTTLYLNSCRISYLGLGTFDNLNSIEKLYLNDNYLVIIPDGLFNEIVPRNPRITLHHNLWYCNCSHIDLLALSSEGLLVVDPICRYPHEVDGFTFKDFSNYCENRNSSNSTDINRNENESDCSVENNERSVSIIDTVCSEGDNGTCEIFKLLTENFTCHTSRIKFDSIAENTLKNIKHNVIEYNSWLNLKYSLRKNHLSMVELTVRNTPGHGLLWFKSSCLQVVYCVDTIPDVIRLFEDGLSFQYTFCPFDLVTGEVNPNLCIAYHLADFNLSDSDSKHIVMIIGFTVLSLMCLIFGAISVYTLINRNPSLLKGNKRILFVKHKEINALILPPQVPLRKRMNNINVPAQNNKKVFFVSTQEESATEFARSASITGPNSNEVSYISAIQPTDEQLTEWRIKQNYLKPQYKSVTSDIYKISNLFESDSLPYYSLNEKIYEVPFNVTKN